MPGANQTRLGTKFLWSPTKFCIQKICKVGFSFLANLNLLYKMNKQHFNRLTCGDAEGCLYSLFQWRSTFNTGYDAWIIDSASVQLIFYNSGPTAYLCIWSLGPVTIIVCMFNVIVSADVKVVNGPGYRFVISLSYFRTVSSGNVVW